MERLNKYLAHAGVGSRRHCDDLILHGRVRVDGQPVRDLGTRVDPQTQSVSVDGRPIHSEPLVYWLVNKPRGYLCTNHDPAGRPRAIDLIQHVQQRVYTVGRLDEDSEGLLLMTNDGDLAYKLTHPRFGVSKTYLVQVAGKPTREELQQLLDGVWLADGYVKAKRVKRLRSQGESTWLEVVLCEGKNREIRRMLAKLEHKVLRLKRLSIGPLRLDHLRKGKSRRLVPDEVALLREATDRKRAKKPNEDRDRRQPLQQAAEEGQQQQQQQQQQKPRPRPAVAVVREAKPTAARPQKPRPQLLGGKKHPPQKQKQQQKQWRGGAGGKPVPPHTSSRNDKAGGRRSRPSPAVGRGGSGGGGSGGRPPHKQARRGKNRPS